MSYGPESKSSILVLCKSGEGGGVGSHPLTFDPLVPKLRDPSRTNHFGEPNLDDISDEI